MYLYGVSIQGIQEFIFKTNKLQEIVGASEIVKSIADEFSENYHPEKTLVNAAGNIKAIFTEEECKKVVETFPKRIMQKAYGITISQAVVALDGESTTQADINKLEQSLKIQRNKPSLPLDLNLNIMKLNPSTAKPVVEHKKIQKKSVPIDRSTQQKLNANSDFFAKNPHLREFRNLSEMSNGKNKIAVIHADGNGLGMLIPKLAEKGMELSEFSLKLDAATKKAFKDAQTESMKIRDVILGGDDMVVICNANDALEFTQRFLVNFEKETESKEGIGYKLTACAGIAYINEKYPFHYAVELAETLCSITKKHAKKLVEGSDVPAPSSLMFHNIQSANFQSWDKFIDNELTIMNDKMKIRCDFGPYYVDEEGEPSITGLVDLINTYGEEKSPISSLRAWVGELHHSHQYAIEMLDRINEVADAGNTKKVEKLLGELYEGLSTETLIVEKGYETDKDGNKIPLHKTPVYDILQIMSATEVK